MVDAVDKLAVYPMSYVGSSNDARPHTELPNTTVTFLCSTSLDVSCHDVKINGSRCMF